MKNYQPQLVVRMLLSILVISTVSACDNTAAAIRRVTYPPDFTYVSGQQLRSRMDQLAFQLQLLDQALTESEIQQQEVVSILGNIGQIGGNLRANEAGSNHPFLQNQMSSFVSDVGEARIAASLDPPSFYLAGRVAGGCVNCHSVNR